MDLNRDFAEAKLRGNFLVHEAGDDKVHHLALARGERIDASADKLLDLQEKEKRAHEAMWENQGKLLRAMQKVHAEISKEIELIVGTADVLETGSE